MFTRPMLIAVVTILMVTPTVAAPTGSFVTERLGYEGSIEAFDTLQRAKDTNNQGSYYPVTDRDIYLGFSESANYALGNWWHTTNTNFGADKGVAGFGNDTGNTGVGYVQLFDVDGSTDTELDFRFHDFDGSYYTKFSAMIKGGSTSVSDGGRLSPTPDNLQDGGIFHHYSIDFTVSGLKGTDADNDGLIVSNDEPTDVVGGFSGIFEITEGLDPSKPNRDNRDFYRFDFDFNLENWAFNNQDMLTSEITTDDGASFFELPVSESRFEAPVKSAAQIPVPTTAMLLFLGLLALWVGSMLRSRHLARSG